MRPRLKNRFVLLALAVALAASCCAAQDNSGAMFTASDGQGHVSLLWFPPAAKWPAGGWRLLDSSGQVLVPWITLGDAAALQALSSEDAGAVTKLPAALVRPDASPAQRKQLINILGLRAFSEPN